MVGQLQRAPLGRTRQGLIVTQMQSNALAWLLFEDQATDTLNAELTVGRDRPRLLDEGKCSASEKTNAGKLRNWPQMMTLSAILLFRQSCAIRKRTHQTVTLHRAIVQVKSLIP
ncbi:Uncharacterised protein [Serratia fonticola]|uniref:Uncharacterized protein n=1 Tax=Serratia fonticola TaxID=47917 RepID=A0A4U9VVK7_SERFO|nr:Uncharacterised protein [Serratia fonticola]